MITVIQNFICTKQDRLDLLTKQICKFSTIFDKYNFIVNYGTDINYEKIKNLYTNNIKKLKFFNETKLDWADTISGMLDYVDTPYVLHLVEDAEFFCTRDEFHNCINEYIENDYDYCLLTKIQKYTQQLYIKKYIENEYGYFYLGKDAGHICISIDAIFKTDWFTNRVKEVSLNGRKCMSRINVKKPKTPNFFEGYHDQSYGIKMYKDLKCYIPKKTLLTHSTQVSYQRI